MIQKKDCQINNCSIVNFFTAKIQALKKTAIKGDKKKKKEVHDEITKLESEMDKRHEEELVETNKPGNNANVKIKISSLNILIKVIINL